MALWLGGFSAAATANVPVLAAPENQRAEIEALSRRNDDLQRELSRRDVERRWWWAALGVTGVAFVGAGSWLLRLRRAHAALEIAHAELQVSQHKLQEQERGLQTVLDEVRALNTTLKQRLLERTLEQQAAHQELEAFSYSVSHDLRAPLRAIDGFNRIMQEDYASRLDPEGLEILQTIRNATQRMGHLINDLLMLANITRAQLVRAEVDLSALARSVADEQAAAAPDRRVEVVIEPALVARGDPRLLRTVLVNLVSNAWKFTARQAAPRVEIGRRDSEAGRAFFVRDNGIGFDPAFADRLFKAFHRLHPTENFSGTGIGLAVVQRIVARHGGRVWAESTPGQGTTLSFTIPD